MLMSLKTLIFEALQQRVFRTGFLRLAGSAPAQRTETPSVGLGPASARRGRQRLSAARAAGVIPRLLPAANLRVAAERLWQAAVLYGNRHEPGVVPVFSVRARPFSGEQLHRAAAGASRVRRLRPTNQRQRHPVCRCQPRRPEGADSPGYVQLVRAVGLQR